MEVANILAFYNTAAITALKSFIAQAPIVLGLKVPNLVSLTLDFTLRVGS